MKKGFFLIVLWLQFSINTFAQNPKVVDSLSRKLETNLKSDEKIDILYLLASEYMFAEDSTLFFKYFNEAKALANNKKYSKGIVRGYTILGNKALTKGHISQAQNYYEQALAFTEKENYPEGKGGILQGMGNIELAKGTLDKALAYYQKALKTYQKNKNQRGIVDLNGNLFNVYRRQGNSENALKHINKALQISKKINYKTGLTNAYNNLGLYHMDLGKKEKALEYLLKAAEISKAIYDQLNLASNYNNIGIIYMDQGKYSKALGYYFKAAEISESLGNKQNLANNYNNIGVIYSHQKEYDQSQKYYLKCLQIDQELGNKNGMISRYINIGTINYFKNNFQKAIEYNLKAIQIANEIGTKANLAMCHSNIGVNYMKLGQYGKAEEYLTKSIEISEESGTFDDVIQSKRWLSELFMESKNYQKAIFYLTAIKEESKQITTKRDVALTLAKAYEATGDYRLAYQNHILFKQLADSILNDKNTRKLTQMEDEFKFNQEKKDLEAQRKAEEIQHKSEKRILLFWQTGIIVGLVLVSLFALLITRYSLLKRKSNQKLQTLNTQISEQSEEIQHQNEELKAREEELRQNMEELHAIHDNLEAKTQLLHSQNNKIMQSIAYASNIQQAILPSEAKLKMLFKDYFVYYKPKDVVSGDFYWTTTIDNQVFIAVVDCTGHGVPGAFMSMIGNTLLQKIVVEQKIYSPAKILEQLHQGIFESLQQDSSGNTDGMDLSICKIISKDNSSYELTFAGAKQSIFTFNGHLTEYKGTRRNIGGFHKVSRKFEDQHITLHQGTRIYMTSDGLLDIPNQNRRKFGKNRLIKFIQENQEYPLSHQKINLEKELTNFNQNAPQRDDILIVGLQIG